MFSSSLPLVSPVLRMALLYCALLAFTWSAFVRLSESGQPEVVYTLVDSVAGELIVEQANPPNSTGPVTVPLTLSDAPASGPVVNDTLYVVRAEPRKETQVPPSPLVSPSTPEGDTARPELVSVEVQLGEESNDTLAVSEPKKPSSEESTQEQQEDIPSFSEWAQKQLAEAEKKKGENATGNGPLGGSVVLKARHSKNYASPDCGAKVVGANPEAISAGSVLSPSRDEYLLNTCNARIWFIVELCEPIQPKKIEIANYELFSSSPKEFSVFLSDRYPTRDWALLGRFVAVDERTVQTFNLTQAGHAPLHFGKYVRVEVHSHYGQEHYCPVSLFRVYGTSEIEVLDTVDEGHQHPVDDDDDELVVGVGGPGEGEAPKNLFGSARDAVLSIVKKAAQALGKSPEGTSNSSSPAMNSSAVVDEPCVTPSHIAVCVNCSDHFYNRMYHMLSCRRRSLIQLLAANEGLVRRTLTSTEWCASRGLDLRVGAPYPPRPSTYARHTPLHYLEALLPAETLAALCNLIAVEQKKVVLNTSYVQAPFDNGTVLVSADDNEVTPLLPEGAGACPSSEGNMSDAPLATQPPFSPPPVTPPPIRPSRTLPLHDDAANSTQEEVNTTTEVVDTPALVNDNITVMAQLTTDKPEVAENVSLVMEVGDTVSLDTLFSELEQAVVPSPRQPPSHKESVFVRLANRIKALERNMSLSSQYLEELSRRYKRQVEELSRTLGGVSEERRRAEERDALRAAQLSQLTSQVEALTAAVNTLIDERDSWTHKATLVTQHGVIVVVEVIVFAVVLWVCRWLPDVTSRRVSEVLGPRSRSEPCRRKSVDTSHPPKPKIRRPSEEALLIAGSTHQELLIPEMKRKISKGETRRQRRKRKREALLVESSGIREHHTSLLDQNSTESVAGWWEEESLSPTLPPPPPPPPPHREYVTSVTPPLRFVQTATAQRQDRIARTSSESSEKENKTFLKKAGPFKKIVKKFF